MKISVCMATYNGGKYIKEQIESILSQLGENDELIISDDISKDNTIDIINSFNDKRIKIYYNKENHGFVRNFENALRKAKGDIIFLSDQDDIWMNDKVQIVLEALQDFDFVVSDCITINDKEEIISKSRIKDYNIKNGFWRLMIKTRYLGCCMAFKKSILTAALPFPKNAYLMEHDLWIAAVSECYFKTKLISQPLIKYRRHGANVSSGGITKGYPLFIKIKRRIYRLIELIKIYPKILKIKKEGMK
ncbi:glycosyltransferase family 2 protein [Clostridium perfringens]|nr:glycosyltransferase family 2 protein [Clostridium perfringens]